MQTVDTQATDFETRRRKTDMTFLLHENNSASTLVSQEQEGFFFLLFFLNNHKNRAFSPIKKPGGKTKENLYYIHKPV